MAADRNARIGIQSRGAMDANRKVLEHLQTMDRNSLLLALAWYVQKHLTEEDLRLYFEEVIDGDTQAKP